MCEQANTHSTQGFSAYWKTINSQWMNLKIKFFMANKIANQAESHSTFTKINCNCNCNSNSNSKDHVQSVNIDQSNPRTFHEICFSHCYNIPKICIKDFIKTISELLHYFNVIESKVYDRQDVKLIFFVSKFPDVLLTHLVVFEDLWYGMQLVT